MFDDDEEEKNKWILPAVIIAAGMIAAVIISKSMDYYYTKKTVNEFGKAVKTSFEKKPGFIVDTAEYRRIWIPGKSLQECLGNNKELNESVRKCRSGYYTTVKVKKE